MLCTPSIDFYVTHCLACLLLPRDQFIVTWHGTSVYIMDPVLGQLVAWYAMEKGKNRKEAEDLPMDTPYR